MTPRAGRQRSYTSAHPRHGARRRPALQVVDASPRPLPERPAHALAQVTPEKVEALAATREVDRPRLLRMQLEPEPREHRADPASRFLDRRGRVAHDHEIIGVADQCAEMRTPIFPHPVEDMQVDVREQREITPPCGVPAVVARPRPSSSTPQRAKAAAIQHPPIRDASRDQVRTADGRYCRNSRGCPHPAHGCRHVRRARAALPAPASRSASAETHTTRRENRLEDRLQHERAAICATRSRTWNAERPLTAVGLGDISPQDRLRAIRTCAQCGAEFVEQTLDAILLDRRRASSRSTPPRRGSVSHAAMPPEDVTPQIRSSRA